MIHVQSNNDADYGLQQSTRERELQAALPQLASQNARRCLLMLATEHPKSTISAIVTQLQPFAASDAEMAYHLTLVQHQLTRDEEQHDAMMTTNAKVASTTRRRHSNSNSASTASTSNASPLALYDSNESLNAVEEHRDARRKALRLSQLDTQWDSLLISAQQQHQHHRRVSSSESSSPFAMQHQAEQLQQDMMLLQNPGIHCVKLPRHSSLFNRSSLSNITLKLRVERARAASIVKGTAAAAPSVNAPPAYSLIWDSKSKKESQQQLRIVSAVLSSATTATTAEPKSPNATKGTVVRLGQLNSAFQDRISALKAQSLDTEAAQSRSLSIVEDCSSSQDHALAIIVASDEEAQRLLRVLRSLGTKILRT